MKKYFGMKKVSVRKEKKSERSEQAGERREKKELHVVSCIFIIARFAASIFFGENNNGVLSERRVFFLPNK